MTIGSESFGSGSAKTDDRFSSPLSGGYRGNGRRESNPLSADHPIEDLGPRNGSGIDRITMPLSSASLGPPPLSSGANALTDPTPIGTSLPAPKLVEPRRDELSDPGLTEPSLTDLGTLSEPMFGRDAWLDAPSGSIADNPLLRGLLLELPPKGTVPPPDWLDRWFEAARSILELLYSQEARK